MNPTGRSPVRGDLADILFPGRCLGCGSWLLLEEDPRIPVCRQCIGLLPSTPEPRCRKCGIELVSEHGTCIRCRSMEFRFYLHRSLFPYQGMAKCLLQALKFQGRSRLARFFARAAAYELMRYFRVSGRTIVVVPVPPRPGRREPDAVALVATRLKADHQVEVLGLLQRTSGVQQKTLGFEQRRANLRGAIRVDARLMGRVPARVVLLDDVFTTGATVDACAHVLTDAGCARVDALTLAMEE